MSAVSIVLVQRARAGGMNHLVHQPLFHVPLALQLLLQTACVHLQHGVLLLQVVQLEYSPGGGRKEGTGERREESGFRLDREGSD